MDDFGQLLRGIAAVLWPVAILVGLFLFKGQLRNVIDRVKRARFPGGEIELEQRLDDLQAQTERLEDAPIPGEPAELEQSPGESEEETDERENLETAAVSPKAALMLLSSQLETAMRRLLYSVGHPPDNLGIGEMSRELKRVAGLPADVVSAAFNFLLIRSLIIHGHAAESDDTALRAVDLGIKILRTIKALPHERHVVTATDIPIYRDPEGNQVRTGVKGVELAAMEDETTEKLRQVFPTTRPWFVKGQQVSWEWDMDNTWDESYYEDPQTGVFKQAWRRSAEFIGRPLDAV